MKTYKSLSRISILFALLSIFSTNDGYAQYNWGTNITQDVVFLQSSTHMVGLGTQFPLERLHISNGNFLLPYTTSFGSASGNFFLGGNPQLGVNGMRFWSESTTPWSSIDIKGTKFTIRLDDVDGSTPAFEVDPIGLSLKRGLSEFSLQGVNTILTTPLFQINGMTKVLADFELEASDINSRDGGINFISSQYGTGFTIHHQFFTSGGPLIIAPITSVGPITPDFTKAFIFTQDGNFLVKKKIYTTEINVVLESQFPDYVFRTGYRLMPFNELRNYIALNNRLPGLPSAQQVEENGLNLGENQRLLVEKVEELTLYILQLEERIRTLEQ